MRFPLSALSRVVLLLTAGMPVVHAAPRALWDGRSLAGWHVIGKGTWKIDEGAIHGTSGRAEKEFGHLVTDRDYTNFTVRVHYRAVKGNSGVYFRLAEKGFSGVTGFQAEIDPEKDAGGLYETNGRSWVSQPKPEDVKRWYKPGVWNEMVVSAHGGSITVTVNGQVTAKLTNDPGRTSGGIALQLHGGQDMDVWFKDLTIEEH